MFEEIWKYQIYSAKTFSLTTGHIISAVVILIIGIIVAKIIKHIIEKRINRHAPNISKHDSVFIQKIVYFVIVIIFLYIALSILDIPLSTVKFLAGGIGIGIGLGLKDYINNFWSGFIIMVEKPFKLGDVVEISDNIGRIWDINFRSTTVHTEENMDIIIPNSVALDESIINWTKKDNMILSSVKIGIGYNSELEHAKDVMIKAAASVEGVLDTPTPFVLFKEHGSSSLIFELFFSINVINKMERWEYESKVNFALNKILRENNIEIPYPYRNLSFDNNSPINIKLNN